MYTLSNKPNEKPIDWLYAQSQQHPLLSAEQEQEIDRDKWQAVEDLQRLLLNDQVGRSYLQQWAKNLLDDPPSLKAFDIRSYYNLLKREHVDLLKKGKHHAGLVKLNKQLEGPPNSEDDLVALSALQLPAVLVTGLAEVVLDDAAPREMGAALIYWSQFWAHSNYHNPSKTRSANEKSIRSSLDDYDTARSKLVNHNLRLVYAIAGRINSRGLPYEDIVQGGTLGLIRAAEKYCHKRGYRFSTYAYPWITQSTRHLVENTQGIVRYPGCINKQISRMYRERLTHLHSNATEPSVKYLAQRLEMEPEALQKLRQVTNRPVSLDTSFDNGGDGLSLAEILPGSAFNATSKEAENRSLNRRLLRTLKVLQPPEQEVVTLRWGLEGLPPLTRAEVASHMQVSTEWVRQLEVSALAKLRQDSDLVETYRDSF